VEVRVLFGALVTKPRSGGASSFSGPFSAGGGEHPWQRPTDPSPNSSSAPAPASRKPSPCALATSSCARVRCASTANEPTRSRVLQSQKGKRFRSVQIGPTLAGKLGALIDFNGTSAEYVPFAPPPPAGGTPAVSNPSHRIGERWHDWHEATLQDAGLRDMPLHSLRHTAATAWLTTGRPLIFVQRRLGHRSITTTEEHYGHLELSFLQDAAAKTEAAVTAAGRET
jgi:Phage integrase family